MRNGPAGPSSGGGAPDPMSSQGRYYMRENARNSLKKFPKDVIIESLIRVAFFSLDDVILECGIIHSDNKLKSLMSQSEKNSKQVLELLNNKPGENVNEIVEWMRTLQLLNDQHKIIHNKIDKLLGL